MFVTGLGAGYFPKAPGTVATLLAIPISLSLNRIAASSLFLSVLTLVSFIAMAAWFCGEGEEAFQDKDCPRIVVDEIGGFLLANFLSPAELRPTALAFLLFRFFDIIKVFPARRAEKIPGGFGVVADDLVAGFYTFLIVRLLLLWGLA